MENRICRIHPATPQPEIIGHAVECIQSGGLVVFPTRTLYGLAVDPFNPNALERLFAVKQRPKDRPVSVLVRDRIDLPPLVKDLTPGARQIMDEMWPGQVTVVLTARDSVPVALTARTGNIGVRMPEHPVAAALVAAVNGPITATSANLSGRPGCRRIQDLHPQLAQEVDMILDAGPLEGGVGSTVVDMTGPAPRILREGTVGALQIITALKRGPAPLDPGAGGVPLGFGHQRY